MPEINHDLLAHLADRPHPLLHIAEDFEAQIREIPLAWTAEIFVEARAAHHLLDLVGIPGDPMGRTSHLDARTWLAANEIVRLREQLERLSSWHSRAMGPGGMVDDHCSECGHIWPCESRQMAEGSHPDLRPPALDQTGVDHG